MTDSDVSKFRDELEAVVSVNDKHLRELLLKRLIVADHGKFSEYDLLKIQTEVSIEAAIAQTRTAIALEKLVSGTVGRKELEERRFNEELAELMERNRKAGY